MEGIGLMGSMGGKRGEGCSGVSSLVCLACFSSAGPFLVHQPKAREPPGIGQDGRAWGGGLFSTPSSSCPASSVHPSFCSIWKEFTGITKPFFFFPSNFSFGSGCFLEQCKIKKKKSYPRAKIDEGSRETGCLSSLNGSFSF